MKYFRDFLIETFPMFPDIFTRQILGKCKSLKWRYSYTVFLILLVQNRMKNASFLPSGLCWEVVGLNPWSPQHWSKYSVTVLHPPFEMSLYHVVVRYKQQSILYSVVLYYLAVILY